MTSEKQRRISKLAAAIESDDVRKEALETATRHLGATGAESRRRAKAEILDVAVTSEMSIRRWTKALDKLGPRVTKKVAMRRLRAIKADAKRLATNLQTLPRALVKLLHPVIDRDEYLRQDTVDLLNAISERCDATEDALPTRGRGHPTNISLNRIARDSLVVVESWHPEIVKQRRVKKIELDFLQAYARAIHDLDLSGEGGRKGGLAALKAVKKRRDQPDSNED